MPTMLNVVVMEGGMFTFAVILAHCVAKATMWHGDVVVAVMVWNGLDIYYCRSTLFRISLMKAWA
jgi:hypothetical protein